MSNPITDLIKHHPTVEGLNFEELLEPVLHRSFILEEVKFSETLDGGVGQVQWHEAHSEETKQKRYTGSKYDPNLDILQIKRAVIEEIKRAEPGVKLSIRTRRHPDELNIDVKAAPYALEESGQLTTEIIALMVRIREVVKQYNFDHGDDYTGYIHNNCWTCIMVLDRLVPLTPEEVRANLEGDPAMKPLDVSEIGHQTRSCPGAALLVDVIHEDDIP